MSNVDMSELHWLLNIVQNIDVGVMVLDREYRIEVWNSFMENHSGVVSREAYQKSVFELFPEIDEEWFRYKAESVALLGTRAFSIWEQRPYLLRFKSYQPITGLEEHMYQNITLLPLHNTRGEVGHICTVIYDVTAVAISQRQLQGANEQLRHLSRTDLLTGLFNRGYWEESLRQAFSRFQRYQGAASLLMFDIDHFKRINDTHGHQAGDQVIRAVAEATRGLIRDCDIAGRYGGEEFVVLLPDTASPGAMALAERLREAVEALRVPHDGEALRFTISLGVAEFGQGLEQYQHIIEQADQALYASKKQGRNRVTLYEGVS